MKIFRLVILLVVLLFTGSVFTAQDDNSTTIPEAIILNQTPTPDVIATAQVMIDEAKDVQDSTLNAVNAFMASVQTTSGVLGILAIIAGATFAVLGVSNGVRLSRQITETEKIKETSKSLDDKQQSLDNKLSELDTKLIQLNDSLSKTAQLRVELNQQITQLANSLLLVQLGTHQVDMGNLDTALEIFRSVRDASDPNADYTVIDYFIGDLYLRQGKFADGMKMLKPIQENLLTAKASYAYAVRAQADNETSDLSKEKLYAESRKVFEELMAEDTHLLDISGESVFGALAGLYKRIGEYDQAVKTYKHCHEITKHSSYPVNNLAILYYCYGDKLSLEADEDPRTKAYEYFEMSHNSAKYALDLSSSDYWNLFDLLTAELALDKADIGDLERHIERIFERNPNPTDIEKLLGGLSAIRDAPNPPKHVNEVIERIKHPR